MEEVHKKGYIRNYIPFFVVKQFGSVCYKQIIEIIGCKKQKQYFILQLT